ncbi:MAG: hypothetical protein Q4D58_02190 [Synergistaceae bacterium]|nr:hypothetical protein [Synergistaceae bacterium]
MKNKVILTLALIAPAALEASSAEAADGIFSASGNIGIAAMVLIVVVCAVLMKKFMG